MVRLTNDGYALEGKGYDRTVGRYLGEVGRVTEVLTLGSGSNMHHIVTVDRFGSSWIDEDVLSPANEKADEVDDTENLTRAEDEDASPTSGASETLGTPRAGNNMGAAFLKILQMLVESGDEDDEAEQGKEAGQEDRTEDPDRGELLKGDYVQLAVSKSELERLAEGHGGYVDDMGEYCGSYGYVSNVRRKQSIVQVTSMGPWWYNIRAFLVVRPVGKLIFEGNLVRLTTNLEKLRSQEGYSSIMDEHLGKMGIATKVDMTKMVCKVQGFGHLWYSLEVTERIKIPPGLRCVKSNNFVGDHTLRPFRTTHSMFCCKICWKNQPAQSWLLSCREDDYDLCWSCAEPKLEELLPNPSTREEFQPSRPAAGSVLICVVSRHKDVSEQTIALLEGHTLDASEGRAYLLGLPEFGSGDGTTEEILARHVERIKHCNCMVVIVTPEYFQSDICLLELGVAARYDIPVFPLAICKDSEGVDNPEVMHPIWKIFKQAQGHLTKTSQIFGDQIKWRRFDSERMQELCCGTEDILRGVERLHLATQGEVLFIFGPLDNAKCMRSRAADLLKQLRPTCSNPRETFHRFWLPRLGLAARHMTHLPLAEGMESHIFLSHAWGEDKRIHRRVLNLKESLRKRGITAWVDEEQMPKGSHIPTTIVEAIKVSQFVGVCVTQEYLQKSDYDPVGENYVSIEYNWAAEHRLRRIVPIVMEPEFASGDGDWGEGLPALFLKKLLNIRYCSEEDTVDRVAEQIEAYILDNATRKGTI
ncbi:E3 ubiquitin-protein ligase MIB2 [Hondaea fermentalgiana]|uniref:E3 ubiquitin-protein ligase MIB2 n=1 Tax=Hondaea fermentalgiana TaxID=2315210 RepID=A0A2R5GY45_9STRA|nr:E3 ubiquitin-protein ligase MIB2 [Hondaea fermentalgiana]|eukprot:GBG33643.1 E3 ubiquitin-protein ligase MIB2 [Hondaea fermentalgiana]